MTITQKKAANKSVFLFESEGLRYSIKDPSGTNSFFVNYEDIPADFSELEERRVWFRNAGVLWVIIGVAQIGYHLSDRGKPGFPFWLLLGLGCLAYYRLSATTFSVFGTPKGRVFVIKDKFHDTVLQEFKDRRNAQLKGRYGKVIDISNPERESARFEWLLKEGIISQDDFENLMAELRLGIASNRPLDEPA